MLQANQHDDDVRLFHREGRPKLRGPGGHADDIRLVPRNGAGRCVSQSSLFTHDGRA